MLFCQNNRVIRGFFLKSNKKTAKMKLSAQEFIFVKATELSFFEKCVIIIKKLALFVKKSL